VNSDVLGWILIPGTAVSYPVVQGTDNDYYLNHTWKKWTSVVGSIFLECHNSRDLSDFNTIIYGHRMNNGSMFASLKNYKKQSWWSDHPCVYITDDSGSHKYEIFAAYEVSTEGETYRLGFGSDREKQAFIDYCLAQSVIDTGVVPRTYDRILTLSTCTGQGHATRWVVQAVLRGEAPQEAEAPLEELPPEEEEKKAPSALDIALGRATGKAEEPAS
ncbi:MAG: class B sortase, partial [Clostridiales bacterium]|nr:class B sortase [Clostridiales bacterium]